MHSPKHAGNKLVDTETFLDQRHKSGYSALVVRRSSKVGKDEFLEGLDLVLKSHQISDGFIPICQ
jgi:hypothetical protein